MILRKPYAFLIKHFKLFHIVLTGIVVFLIYKMSTIISFISWYLNSNLMLITMNQFKGLYNVFDFVGPILILIFSVILFLVMTLKKKPNKFYLYSMIIGFLLLVINTYGYFTLRSLTEVWLDVNRLNILSDIYVFMMLSYVALCGMSLSRAIGFNIGRFDFNNDISEFELSEEDNEEFEFSIDFDINDTKRNAKKQIRYLKYFYKENKQTIFGVLGLIVIVTGIYGLATYLRYRKDIVKGNILDSNGFSITVNNSYIIDNNAFGTKFEDNIHLLVIDVDITNTGYRSPTSFTTGYLSVNIGSDNYSVTEKYESSVVDLGKIYVNEKINFDASLHRLLVFEVPENHLFSKILFGVRDVNANETHYLKISPKNLSKNDNKIVEKFLGEELTFDESAITNSKIKIDSFEINNKFKINYRFCTNKNKCVNSIEYLVPKNNTSNFDKTIIKLNGTFEVNDNVLIKNFYTLFDTFGYIEYKLNGKTYKQTTGFREIKSTKLNDNNTYYIETYKDLLDAESICLGLQIRNMNYRYYLKQEVR